MKNVINANSPLWVLFAAAIFLAGTATAAPPDPVVPGQAIVKMKGNANVNAIADVFGAQVVDSIEGMSAYLITFPEDLPVDSVVGEIGTNSAVEYAHSNRSMSLPETSQMSQGFPDQKNVTFAKGVSPSSYYEQPGIYNTGIDSAHTISTGQGQIVAVIDNGVVFDHPLIAATTTVFQHDFITPDGDASETAGPLFGHGTFVTSMVLLVAPDCAIMPLRAFDENGIGDQFAVAQAVDWAVSHGASVINLSCGSESAEGVLQEAILDAYQSGVSLVASAGNESSSAGQYPALDPVVIAVTSIDTLELLADFANYGDYLDLCAPGVNLYGALPGEYDWGTWSGTSFSAPLVSGTIALVRAVDTDLLTAEVQEHLNLTARSDLLWGAISPPDYSYGYGALDVFEAVQSLTVGDLDLSGTRDEQDLGLLQQYVHSGRPNAGAGIDHRRCDINCDGIVDIDDIVNMIEKITNENIPFEPCYR